MVMAEKAKTPHRYRNAPQVWNVRDQVVGPTAVGEFCKRAGLDLGPQVLLGLYIDRDMASKGLRKGVAFPSARVLMKCVNTERADTIRAWKRKLIDSGVIVDLYESGKEHGAAAVGIRYDILLDQPIEGLIKEGAEPPAWARTPGRPQPAREEGSPNHGEQGRSPNGDAGGDPDSDREGAMEAPEDPEPSEVAEAYTPVCTASAGEADSSAWLHEGPANEAADTRSIPEDARKSLLPKGRMGMIGGGVGDAYQQVWLPLTDAGKLRRFLEAMQAEQKAYGSESRHWGSYSKLAWEVSQRIDAERGRQEGWREALETLAAEYQLRLRGGQFEGNVRNEGQRWQVSVIWQGVPPQRSEANQSYLARVECFYEIAIAEHLLMPDHQHYRTAPLPPIEPNVWYQRLDSLAKQHELEIADIAFTGIPNLPDGKAQRVSVKWLGEPPSLEEYQRRADDFYRSAVREGLLHSTEGRWRNTLVVEPAQVDGP